MDDFQKNLANVREVMRYLDGITDVTEQAVATYANRHKFEALLVSAKATNED